MEEVLKVDYNLKQEEILKIIVKQICDREEIGCFFKHVSEDVCKKQAC